MSETNQKEIWKEKEITKPTEKASIYYKHQKITGYNQGEEIVIEVKDTTSEIALKTFKKLRKVK